MRNRYFTAMVYGVIGLALFGLVIRAATDTKGLLVNLLMIIGITAVLSAIAYLFLFKKRQPASPDTRKYRQAVKQSKRKYEKKAASSNFSKANRIPNIKDNAKSKKRQHKKRPSHLRVIEGSKQDKKDRALF